MRVIPYQSQSKISIAPIENTAIRIGIILLSVKAAYELWSLFSTATCWIGISVPHWSQNFSSVSFPHLGQNFIKILLWYITNEYILETTDCQLVTVFRGILTFPMACTLFVSKLYPQCSQIAGFWFYSFFCTGVIPLVWTPKTNKDNANGHNSGNTNDKIWITRQYPWL